MCLFLRNTSTRKGTHSNRSVPVNCENTYTGTHMQICSYEVIVQASTYICRSVPMRNIGTHLLVGLLYDLRVHTQAYLSVDVFLNINTTLQDRLPNCNHSNLMNKMHNHIENKYLD